MKNSKTKQISLLGLVVGLLFAFSVGPVNAQVVRTSDPELNKIDVVEHLGAQIPLDVVLTDAQGEVHHLADYYDGHKPVVLILAYYHCPMLCNLVLDGVTRALYSVRLKFGEDYRVLTVSIDPRDTPQDARQKKESMLERLQQPLDSDGWEFLIGEEAQVKRLADAVGFEYFFVEEKNQYAHPAVIMLTDGTGKVSRYLYGIEYRANDIKLGLLEAAQGKIGTTTDKILLFCFHYDPDAKGYVLFASNLMKAGGLLTLAFLAFFIAYFRVKGRKQQTIQGSVS